MMVKPQQFDIILGSPRAVYKAGAVVTGSLVIHADQPQLYTSLGLKFSGKGRVRFSSKTEGGRQKQIHTNKEVYFKRDVRLLPRGNASMTNETMEEGHHEFPFTFTLPATIPSSFECASGSVRYCVKAKLELGWADSVSIRKYFIVFKPLDLNDHVSARTPEEQETDSGQCCVPWCTANHVTARASIPRQGYVPGETIHVQWELGNIWVRKIYFTIDEVSYCRASNHETNETSETLKTFVPTIGTITTTTTSDPTGADDAATAAITANNTMTSGRDTITVPMAVPSGLEGSRIIDVDHRLVLHVVSMVPSCSLNIPLNIVIGTTPLADHRFDMSYNDNDDNNDNNLGEESPLGMTPAFPSVKVQLTWMSSDKESLPRRSSLSSVNAIMGIQPPAYSPPAENGIQSRVPSSTDNDVQVQQEETPM